MRKDRLFSIGAVAAMSLALLLALAPPGSAANPALVQQTGGIGAGVTTITLNLGSLSSGDAIIAFEYFQTSVTPCSYLLAPTDTVHNTWRTLGCQVDGAFGAQAVYYVQASGAGPSDAVTCNFATSGALTTEACYVFDVSNPAGTITLADTGTGTGGYTVQVPVLVSANSNSLLLATVGYTGGCHGVTASGQSPSGINPIIYNPASQCSQGTTSYGMSGSYVATVAAGSYQWVMDPVSCPSCGGGGSISPAWSLMVVQIPGPAAITTSTSYSNTVVGWLAPDSAHFANSLILMIYPLMGLVVGTTIAKMFRIMGDVGVYFALGGLTAGAFLADLPTTNSPANYPLLIPFAYGFVAALLTFLYWWNS